MFQISRRKFLSLASGPILGSMAQVHASSIQRPAPRPHTPFSFVFLTDTHLQPELNANSGCHDAFLKSRTFPADFAIQGGDHVFDALGVNAGRAKMLVDLYKRTADDLLLDVHHTIGNHDCFGVYTQSGAKPTDPMYGKKYFEDNFGQLYYSFDHKGIHFVILDSIGITDDRGYEGRVDAKQLEWLKQDLASQPSGMPIIAVTHIPLVTAVEDYAPPPLIPAKHHGLSVINAYEIISLFDRYNVIGVLQGHNHVLERIEWHGVPYITGGAVCGNWWHGTRYGTPEGFMVVDVINGKLNTQYITYGFKSIDPKPT